MNLPITVGYGSTGIVTAVGSLRSSSLVGQTVLGANPSGAAQEIISNNIPPILFKIPDNVDLDEAATIIGGVAAALMATTNDLKVNANDTVLVTIWWRWHLPNSTIKATWGTCYCHHLAR